MLRALPPATYNPRGYTQHPASAFSPTAKLILYGSERHPAIDPGLTGNSEPGKTLVEIFMEEKAKANERGH
jgi:hypothetical protein